MSRLKTGDPAPDFEAPADSGDVIRLRDFLGKKVILYFYPKDDTSGCTAQACGFRDAFPRIERAGAVVLGVSPDGQESHRRFKQKHDLPFTLLVDADHSIAEKYGAWGEKSMYGRKYFGIIRSHFVIDSDGRLLDVKYKANPRKSAEESLAILESD
jgi:thioredoxin-dependent peroxiredoxin